MSNPSMLSLMFLNPSVLVRVRVSRQACVPTYFLTKQQEAPGTSVVHTELVTQASHNMFGDALKVTLELVSGQ